MEGGSTWEVLTTATRLGLTSFGGPIAHIGYFRHEYVERRAWLDDAAFADLVALCQSLPGPASSQLGFAIGLRRSGWAGGLAAWLGFTAPSAAILIGFGLLSTSLDVSTAGWVHGLKLAAVAIVAQAVLVLLHRLAPDWPRRVIAAAAAVLALAVPVAATQVLVIAGGGLVAALFLRSTEVPPAEGRTSTTVSPRAGLVAIIAFLVLLAATPVARAVGSDAVASIAAFARSGALVFGGGHVVLPLLHAGIVDPGWVSDGRFVAGYGAAQAVPGPLFTFAGFLGTVSSAPPGGVAGGTLAIIAIFAPGLLVLIGVLPFWDRFRSWRLARQALAGTNAAVVGILAAALYTPVWTSAVLAPIDVAIAAVGFGLLFTGRVAPIVVVGLSALAGQLLATA